MPYNVLIVDDSKSMRQILRKILAVSGFNLGECLEASNGEEALRVLEDNWVDLILSDIHMPVMDGLGLLRNLRKHSDWSDLPVVLVTTESNEDRIQEAISLGARGYVRKPFKPEEIRAHLNEIIGESDGDGTAFSDGEGDF
ncbi:MAG: PleD family two-component system response regulator [Syntrophobacteraceae bacterium]